MDKRQAPSPKEAHKVIWWNLQRLFYPSSSKLTRALDATASAGWTRKAYTRKLDHVAAVLRAICGDRPPALLGLGEVENGKVVRDLRRKLAWPALVEAANPREKLEGYDVTLLYSKDLLRPNGAPRSHNVHNRFETRDIFEVRLKTRRDTDLLVLVNHWPSRLWTGSEGLRIGLADYCARIIDRALKFQKEELTDARGTTRLLSKRTLEKKWNTPVLVMGDLNDEPFSPSVDQMLCSTRSRAKVERSPRLPSARGRRGVAAYLRLRPRLYNPTWRLLSGRAPPFGTVYWNGSWYALDQLLVSRGLLTNPSIQWVDASLAVFDGPRVPLLRGQDEVSLATASGCPRAFDSRKLVGVSDHFPLTGEIAIR